MFERHTSINQLQDEYDVPSLNTIRRAQQMLVEEGYLRTEQGRGAFVIAYPNQAIERERRARPHRPVPCTNLRARRLLSSPAAA
ncbi:GntR family transcriptional regulator [Lentzea terrae]|uniref:GntR family transcriptional regulator n=1 Tax=Lentzea terrae TaxID=2200761 RepID=UPI000DD361A5